MKDAYVLMRIYNPVVAGLNNINKVINSNWTGEPDNIGSIEKNFYNRLKTAIHSVWQNKAKMIICDDTPRTELWDFHHKHISEILDYYGFNCSSGNLFFTDSKGGEGSSLAMWRLRKHFLDITERNENLSFAVLLDQDDQLYPDAIKSIAKKMEHNAVVISNYKIRDAGNLNIVMDDGKMHKRALKLVPYFYNKWIPALSSIGWTKAYSREAMKIMVSDFEAFFQKTDSGSAELFFSKHKAYEDFLDIYVLIHKSIQVKTNTKYTHIYNKHINSITANPSLEAFTQTRISMLKTICHMCCDSCCKLKDKWEDILTGFLSVKIKNIEDILQKYKNDACHGMITLSRFTDIRDGFFTLMLEKECQSQHMPSSKYISDAIRKYQSSISKSVKYHNQQKWPGKAISFKRQFRHSTYTYIIVCALILFITIVLRPFQIYEINLDLFVAILSIVIPIAIETDRIRRQHIEKEESQRKVFFSEFKDMTRHLEANLKVLIQIRKQLELEGCKSGIPEPVHFENLKLPMNSTLFSEEILLLINRELVDDITRLQINLRNMNNSAEWLKTMVSDKANYSEKDFIQSLDWEIYRIMAYLVNAYYMDTHHYCFATETQLDEYFTSEEIHLKLKALFMDSTPEEKESMVIKYITMYYEDRRIKRNVNFKSLKS